VSAGHPSGTEPAPRVAVVVSRYPKFTETFVVNEILALERLGIDVEVDPLLPEEKGPQQPAVRDVRAPVHFGDPWAPAAIRALVATAWRQPAALSSVLGRLARDTWRHPAFLLKDLVLLPRICSIARSLRGRGVTHVHAHFATHAGFAAWVIGRLTGLPYSIVAHGSDVHRHRAMMRTKFAEAAFVATVSEFNRRVIEQQCGPDVGDRVKVVRFGVDTSAVGEPEATAEPGAEPVVVCVGTLHEVKGQRYLIEAVHDLVGRGRSVRLVLVGEGADRRELEDLARSLGVDDRVRFEGAVPHRDVIALYRRADVVVAPSVPSRDGRKEGIPTVLIEAMAVGVPVVASDLTGIPELVEHDRTGLLFEPGNSEELAGALERLAAEPGLGTRLAQAGRRRVVEDYDIDRTAAQIADLMGLASQRR
jgi:colanic acid/amylovoran biosynthesis glycosyltransferase